MDHADGSYIWPASEDTDSLYRPNRFETSGREMRLLAALPTIFFSNLIHKLKTEAFKNKKGSIRKDQTAAEILTHSMI